MSSRKRRQLLLNLQCWLPVYKSVLKAEINPQKTIPRSPKDLQGVGGCRCRGFMSCREQSSPYTPLVPHPRSFIALPHFPHSWKQGWQFLSNSTGSQANKILLFIRLKLLLRICGKRWSIFISHRHLLRLREPSGAGCKAAAAAGVPRQFPFQKHSFVFWTTWTSRDVVLQLHKGHRSEPHKPSWYPSA